MFVTTMKAEPLEKKTIAFLYQHAICFLPTDMVKSDFPMSEKFLYNMIAIFKNKHVIHW